MKEEGESNAFVPHDNKKGRQKERGSRGNRRDQNQKEKTENNKITADGMKENK